ncbi:iron export ABC transporter permease subunit FetB [Bacillus sp. V59.32b]|uniref:ABC transporter permease n=1 Tax=Bacillus sp. V59.32b TaxID=1758642 RepID=UPI000E3C4AD2|nr:iron export ABC transporter permease subunit FetB [Bacillus sp. V59.32b]RFU69919.1 iron export ABC transporter permease subunit FetB [Bacillus sp. V59.32b]
MDSKGIIDIELWRLGAAYLFVIILLLIVKWRGISRERRIIIATVRMTLQLVLAGYVLTYIFDNPHPLLSIGFLSLMEILAIRTIFKQLDRKLNKKIKLAIVISMVVGPLAALLYFNGVVIHFQPWYEPRYFIPIAGMIIGNAMTGITLGMKTLLEGLTNERDRIEGALMLGATPSKAVKRYTDRAFDSAVLPTLNNMLGMGIIFLPGMMTGQILAGISPMVAIEYQIAILLGILGSVSLAVILFILLAYRVFFTKEAQLDI